MPYRELLIGCGARREKCPGLPTAHELRHGTPLGRPLPGSNTYMAFQNLTTLDNNSAHQPDLISDLTRFDASGWDTRFFCTSVAEKDATIIGSRGDIYSDTFDEIHAYEVLEHIGAQGDYRAFFAQFTEFHRILKPGGFFFATCPSFVSMWAWGDPSHTRVLTSGTLSFLSQAEYAKQVGVTPMSDFRHVYKADFEPRFVHEDQESLRFVLEAIKRNMSR